MNCREQDPGLPHPHSLPMPEPFMETVKHMRLQVSSVTPSDEAIGGCCDINPTCDGGGPSVHRLQSCTVVISNRPENSTSVQLFMGGDAPPDAPALDCSKGNLGSLSIAVYQIDTRIAHAVIPLDQVWEVCYASGRQCISPCCQLAFWSLLRSQVHCSLGTHVAPLV
jgi:hypothetical protein